MDALSINADPRPLPPGWTAHFDHQRNMWYYVDLNTMPPQLHLVHPADQGRESEAPAARPRRDTVPSGPMSHRQHEDRRIVRNFQHSTPFAAAIEAQNAKEPTFAQMLYASSLPASLPPPTQSSDNEGTKGLYGFSNYDAPWRTPSPLEGPGTIATQTTSSSPPVPSISILASPITASPTSSPPSFSSPLPDWIPPTVIPAPSRRPRGARTPSFPRTSVASFSHPAKVGQYGDLVDSLTKKSSPPIPHGSQALLVVGSDIPHISSVTPPPPPPPPPPLSPLPSRAHTPAAVVPASRSSFHSVNYSPPIPQNRTRHNRSATFPNLTLMNPTLMNPTSSCSQASTQPSKPKETPMYTLVARPPGQEPMSAPANITSFPKSINLLPISPTPIKAKPNLAPLIIPNSSGTGLPQGAAIANNNNNPMPNMNVPPTQPLVDNDQRQTLAQGGIANLHQERTLNPSNATHGNNEVLKRVGIAVGKSAGKSALRLGAKVLLGNMGISTNSFSSDKDVGDVISSGLTNMVASAATAGATAAIESSLNRPTTIPSSTNTNLTPDHAAILAQMQGMQLQQPAQQIMPQQSGFDSSNAQMAALMAQMQMLQLQQQQFRQSPQIPFGNYAMAGQNTMHHIPQQQRPQWQQSLVNNVIGGATHALVSGPMPNFDFPSTMDSDNAASSFTDFASFDART